MTDASEPATVRHGVDIVAIDRLAELLREFGDSFRDRICTDAEQAYCEAQADPPQHYAARWAATEAFIKCLSDPSPGVPFSAIEIERHAHGPELSLAPVAADALAATLDEAGVDPDTADTAVSLSHDQQSGYAIGSVTVVGTASRHD